MARRVERGQQASARTLPSDQGPSVSQPPRPGTPFSVPQRNSNTVPQLGNLLQGSQPPRPGTPFTVPQPDGNTLPQQGKHLTSRDPRDFAPPGLLRRTRYKFRCPNPYEDQRFKKPDAHVTEKLQKLKALVKASAKKRTSDPLRNLKENKKWTVTLPLRVPEGTSHPLTRDTRPSVLQPATRKRVASSSVPIPGKVKRSQSMSTVFEEPMDFAQLGDRVPAASSKNGAGDASHKFKEDHTVPGPSSAGQHGQVISPHIQGSPHPSRSSQGDLGSSTSPQDAQGLSLSTQHARGLSLSTQQTQGLSLSTQDVFELTRYFQESMGHSTSAQASQRLPTCAERKIIHASSSRRSSKRLSPTLHNSNLSNSPLKHVGQDSSGQGDLQQAPSDKEGSKPPSPKGNITDFSFVSNVSTSTSSPQESSTCLTAAKAGHKAKSSHKDSQRRSPSPPKCPMQSASSKVSLRPDPADQEDFRTSPLNQEGFQSPLPLKNGLRSSLTVQRERNAITIPKVRLTPLIPAQAETKFSTPIPGAQGPLPSLEGALESSTHRLGVIETPESSKGTLVPSAHTQSELEPSASSPGVLRPSPSVRWPLGLSPSMEEHQRHVLKSALPQKGRLNHSPVMKSDPEHSHSSRGLKDALSKQRVSRKSRSDQELFKYPLPAKRALLTCHQVPNSQDSAKMLPGSQTSSIFVQCDETIQPSMQPMGTLGHSVSVGEDVKNSQYTSKILRFPKPVQDPLSTTLSHKGFVGQDTSTKGVLATVPSLEMTRGCDTSTKDVLGQIPSVQKVLDPILCEQGAVGGDLQTQESVASCITKEGNSLDSTCAQESIGPPQTSQETMRTSLSPQEDQPSSPTTQDAIDSYPPGQRAVGPSPCPQMSPEYLRNAQKALGSTSSSKGPLEPVLPIKLATTPDTSIQKVLSPSQAEENFLGTSTSTQGGLEISLPAQEALIPLTYVHDALGEATSTQVSLGHSPHSEATGKTCTGTQDTLRPSPSVQMVIGSTISEQGALQLSPSTQECSFSMPSLMGSSRPSPSTHVFPKHPVSTKNRLRVDPSDKGDSRTSDEMGLASSPAAKETSIATTTPQVSPTPSVSVQNALKHPTDDQGTVESCQSDKGHGGHSIFPQKAQGLSLSNQKALVCSPSGPELQGISLSLSNDPEHFAHAQGDWSVGQSDFRMTQPPLYYQGSKGKSTSKKNHLELVPLAQTYQKSSMSSKASKKPSASNIIVVGQLPSALGSARSLTSKHEHLKTLPAVQRSLGCLAFSPGALGVQGTTEHLPPGQGVQKTFPSSTRCSGYSLHLPGDLDLSSSAQGVSRHAPPTQGPLESSSCSPEFAGPLMSLQRPLDLSTTIQSTDATSPSTQGTLAPLLSLPSKTRACQGTQRLLGAFPPRPGALAFPPSDMVAPGPLPVGREPVSLSLSSQEPPSNLPHIHGVLDLSQSGSGSPLNVMPLTQWQQGTPSSSEGSVAPLSSVEGAVGKSLSAQQTPELSTSTQGTLRHSFSVLGDRPPSSPSKVSKGPLSSVDVDMGTYSDSQRSPGHLKNVSGFPSHMLPGPDPVGISLPTLATESLVSSSSCQGLQGSLLSTKDGGKNSLTAANAQKPDQFTSQTLELLTTTQGPLPTYTPSKQTLHSSPSTLGDFQLQRTLEMSSLAQGTLDSLVSSQKEGTKYKSEKDIVRQSISLQGTVEPSCHKTGALGSTQYADRVAQIFPSNQGAEIHSLRPTGAMGLPTSETRALENSPSKPGPVKIFSSFQKASTISLSMQDTLQHPPSVTEAVTSSPSTQGTKKTLLSSQGTVKLSTSAPHHTTTGTLTIVTCKQGPLEHSAPVQGTEGSSTNTSGKLEHSASLQKKLEHSSHMVESLDNLPSGQETTTDPLPIIGSMGPPKSEIKTPENFTSEKRSSESTRKSKKTLLSSQGTVGSSSSAPHAQKPPHTTTGILTIVTCKQGPLEHSEPVQGTEGSSTNTSGKLEHSASFQKKLEHSSHMVESLDNLPSGQETTTDPLPLIGSMGPPKSETKTPENFTSEKRSSESTRKSKKTLLSSQGTVGSSSSAPHAQKPPHTTTGTLTIVTCKQGPLEHSAPVQGTEGSSTNTSGKLEHSASLQKKLEHSSHMVESLDNLPSGQETTTDPLPLIGSMGPPKSETRTPENFTSEKRSSESTRKSKKTLLSSQGTVGSSSSSPHAQKPPHTTTGTLTIVTCKQGPLEHSGPVQGTEGSSTTTSGKLEHSASFQKKLEHSSHMVESLDNLPSGQETTTDPLPLIGSMGPPKSKTKTPENFPSEQRSSISTRRTKKTLLSSQGTLEPSSSVLCAQKLTQTTSGTLTSVRCKQAPLEHSIPVQETVGTLPSIPGFLEHLPSYQQKPGDWSFTVESQDTSPSLQGAKGPLPHTSNYTGHSQPEQRSQVSSLEVSSDLAHLLSTKLSISVEVSLDLSPYTQQSMQQSSSSQEILGSSESAQCTHQHFPSMSGSLGMPSWVPRTPETLPHVPKPHGHCTPTQAGKAPPPFLQKAVATSLYPQSNLEQNGSAQISPLLSQSTQLPGQVSLNAEDRLGEPIAAQVAEEFLPLTSQGHKNNCTVTKGTLPVQSSLSSTQSNLEPSTDSTGILELGQCKHTETILGPLPLVREDTESSPSALLSLGTLPPSPREPDRHSSFIQGGTETFPSGPGNLAHLQAAQGPLTLSISAQAMTHISGSAEGALLHSSPSPAVSETNKYSPSTRGTSDTSRYAGLHLDLTTSLQVTPSSLRSEQGTLGTCLSKVTKSKETTVGFSASAQGTRGHSLSAQAKVGKPMSAKQTVGTLPPTSGSLGSTQINPVASESLSSDQKPLGISLSSPGTLGSSSSKEASGHLPFEQGSLKLSTNRQGTVQTVPSSPKTLQHPTYCQKGMRFSPLSELSGQRSPASSWDIGPLLPSQKSQKSISYSPADVTHSPSVPGTQGHPLSSKDSQGYLLTSQKCKDISTAAEGTLPVQSSLSSTQRNLEPLVDSTGRLGLGKCKHTETTSGPLPLVREHTESSASALPTLGPLPPSPREHGRHSSFTQGGAETFPSGPGNLAHLQSAQGTLTLSISAQALTHISGSAEGALLHSAPSPAVSETNECSPSTQGTSDTFRCAGLHLDLTTSLQVSPSSLRSEQGSLGTGSSEGTKSKEKTVGFSISAQGTRGHSLSGQDTLGKPMSAKQSVGNLPPTLGRLGSTQITRVVSEYLTSDQKPLGISSSSPGTLGSSSSIEASGHSLSDQGSLKLSTTRQRSLQTVQTSPKSMQHPSYCQKGMRISPVSEPSGQRSPASSRDIGPLLPSQKSQKSISYSPADVTHSPSVLGTQGHPLSSKDSQSYVLTSQKCRDLSTAAEGTLPVKSSLSSTQRNLEPLADSTGILGLGQCKHTEATSGPLPLERENTESSTSALPTLGSLPPSPREPGRHSFLTQGGAETFPSGPRNLAHLQSAQGPLTLSISTQAMTHISGSAEGALLHSSPSSAVSETNEYSPSTHATSDTPRCARLHLDLTTSLQVSPSSLRSEQGTVGSCSSEGTKSKETTVGFSASAQGTRGHSLSGQATLGKPMSAKQSVGNLPPTPGPLGSTQIIGVVSESLTSDQKPLGISSSSPGILGSSSSIEASGHSLSDQGSLKLSITRQGSVQNVPSTPKTVQHPTYCQKGMKFSPLSEPSGQRSPASSRDNGQLLPSQKSQKSISYSPADVTHSPSVLGTQGHPLSIKDSQGYVLTSQKCKDISTAAEGTLPVQRSLSSTQMNLEPSADYTGILGLRKCKHTENTSGPLPVVRENTESSTSTLPTLGPLLPPLREPGRHSPFTQGGAETFPSGPRNLAHLQSAQGPLTLSISAQAMTHISGSAEGALQYSAPSPAVSETNEYSPSTQGTSDTPRCAGLHLDLTTSLQVSPSSLRSEQNTMGPFSSEGTKSKETTVGFSASAQGTRGHSLSGQATLGKPMSAKQSVGNLPPTPGPLGSTQITRVVSESLSSDQKPLGISSSSPGSLGSSSSIEASGHSLSDQGSLKLFTTRQLSVQTVPSSPKIVQHPTYCQKGMGFTPLSEPSGQRSPASSWDIGPLLPSQTYQKSISYSPADVTHSPSVLGTQGHPLSSKDSQGYVLTSQKCKDLSTAAEGTLPVQRSLSSTQMNLEPSADYTGILGLRKCKHTETTSGPLPLVRENTKSSTSTLPTLGPLPPPPREPGRHSSFTQGGAETFPSGPRNLAHLQSAQGPLTLSISAQAMTHISGSAEGALLHSAPSSAVSETNEYSPSTQGTSDTPRCAGPHLDLTTSLQVSLSSLRSEQKTVGPCSSEGTKSKETTVGFSASAQGTREHSLSGQATVGMPMSAKQSVENLLPIPVPLGSPQITRVVSESLTSDQKPLGISSSSPGNLGSSSSIEASGHSLSDQGSLKLSTTRQGSVQTVPSTPKTVQHPTSCQKVMKFSPLSEPSGQRSPASSRDIGPLLPSQKSQKSISYSPADVTHSPSVLGTQGHPLSSKDSQRYVLTSQKCRDLSTAAEGTLPVKSSLSSTQRNLEPLADSTGILGLGQCKHTETTSGPLPLERENTESSTSALPTLGSLPPSPREPGRHSFLTQGGAETFPSGPRNLAHLQSAQGPLTLSISAQAITHISGSAEGALLHSAPSSAVSETNEYSPSTQGTSDTPRCAGPHLDLTTSLQVSLSSLRSEQKTVGPCSSEGTKSKETTVGFSASAQGTREHSLSGQATVGMPMSAKQSVENLLPIPVPLGSPQITRVVSESLTSDQKPLGISSSSPGSLGSSSSIEASGHSLSDQGSLKLSITRQGSVQNVPSTPKTVQHPTYCQKGMKFSPLSEPSGQRSPASSRDIGQLLPSQKSQKSISYSPADVTHSPSVLGTQGHPLSSKDSQGYVLTSQKCKDISTAAEGTLPVQRSLSSTQMNLEPSADYTGILGLRKCKHTENTSGPLPVVRENTESSTSTLPTLGPLLPPLREPGRHSPFTQGGAETFPSGPRNLAHLQSAQGPLTLSISAQAMTHISGSAEGALQYSAPSPAVSETNEYSPSTQGSSDTPRCAGPHLDLTTSLQVSPSSLRSEQGTVGSCSSEGTKSKETIVGFSASAQGTRGHSLSGQATLGKPMSAKQSVGNLPPTPGPLGTTQIIGVVSESFTSDQKPLGISSSSPGILGSSSSIEASGHSLSDQGSLKLSITRQGSVQNVPSTPKTVQHPTYCQKGMRFSPLSEPSGQRSPASSWDIGPLLPSQTYQKSISYSPADVTHSPSVLGTQGHPLSSKDSQGYVLTSQKCKDLSTAADGTLPVQRSLSSTQMNLEPSADYTGILGLRKCKHTETTSGPLPLVRENTKSSTSTLPTLGHLPPPPREPGRHSSFTQGGAETFPSGPRNLAHLQSAQGPLTISISTQAMTHISGSAEGALLHSAPSSAVSETNEYSPSTQGTSDTPRCAGPHLDLTTSLQVSPSSLRSEQKTVGPCSSEGTKSKETTVGFSASAQGTREHSLSGQATVGMPMSAKQSVENLLPIPVPLGSPQITRVVSESLTSDQKPLGISSSSPGILGPSSSIEASGHSLYDQGSLKLSTTRQGSVQTVPSTPKTVQHPTSCQKVMKFSPLSEPSGQRSPASSRDIGPLLPSQKSQKSISYSPADVTHSPSVLGTQGHPLSSKDSQRYVLTSQKCRDLSTAAEGTLPVKSSLSSTQRNLEPLSDSTGILGLGQCKHTETTSGPLPLERENTESSTSALPTLGSLPPSPREPGRHSFLTQGGAETFPSGPRNLAHLQSVQGPLTHSISAQAITHISGSAEGALLHSAPSSAVSETNEYSPSTHGTSDTPRCARVHLDLTTSLQVSPSSLRSEQGTVGSCSSEGTKSKETTVGFSASAPVTRGHSFSGQATLGKPMSAKQSVGKMPPTPGSLGTTQITRVVSESLTSDQKPLGISSSSPGTLGSSSSIEASGHSLYDQGSLKLSTTMQGSVQTVPSTPKTVKHPAYCQKGMRFSPLSEPSGQRSPASSWDIGPLLPSQTYQKSISYSPADVTHSPSVLGTQGHPLSSKDSQGYVLTSQKCKDISTAAEGTLPVQSSLSSTQMNLEPSADSTGILGLGQCKHIEITSSPLPLVRENTESSTSVLPTLGPLPPSPREPGRHSSFTQGGAEIFPSGPGNLAHFQSAQGPLTLSISAQAMTHNSGSAEGVLLHSAPSSAVSETNEYSPSTPGTSDTPRCAGLHLDLTTSLQVSPSSLRPEHGTLGPCSSEECPLEVTKSKETSLGSSTSAQGTEGNFLPAEATVGKSLSAKETVGTLLPTPGHLRSTQNTQLLPESVSSDQMPLGICSSSQGTLLSSSFQEAFGHFCSAERSLKLPISKQGNTQSVSFAQDTLHPPTSCQTYVGFSPTVHHFAQRSPAFPSDSGTFLPSQKSQETFYPTPSDIGHCQPVLGVQEHLVPTPVVLVPISSFQKPKELSRAQEGTLPMQSSIFPKQRNLENLTDATGILAQYEESQSALGLFPQVRQAVASSQSTSAILGTLPPSPPKPGRHSSSVQGVAKTFPFGQGYLAPLQSAQGPLKLSISAQAMMNTSQCCECSHNPLGLSSSKQGTPASSDSAHGDGSPGLSAQGTVYLSTCPQMSTQHSTSSKTFSSLSLHTQGIGTQSTSTHYTVADSPSFPVCQGYTHHAQNTARILRSDQGSLRISATTQGPVEPLPPPQGTLGYSSFASGAQKFSTATPGHVISNESPLELAISAQLSSSLSSLSLLDSSLSTEEPLDLSKPTEGPLTSFQGPNESLNSPHRVQQTDPSASDPSGSMHSSKGPMVISLSGRGTLGSVSSALEPLTMSLSAQVNPGPLLSVQEARGTCLSLQGNLESCTCTHGKPGISNASPGALEISASTIVSLGPSPSVQLDLKLSHSVLMSRRPSLSAQGVLETSISSQGLTETSLLTQEPPGPCLEKEAFGYSPSNPEDLGLSDSSQDTLETHACMQNSAEIPPVTQEVIESLSATQDSPKLPAPSPLRPEAEEPLTYTQSISQSSESVPETPEALASVLGSLCLLKPNEGALGPLVSEQGILRTPAFPQESLELSQPAQGPLKPVPSPPGTMGASFSKEFQGLSLCAEGDIIPTPPHEDVRRNSSYLKKSPRRFKSNQSILKHVPFPEGDIRYCLSDLDALKCISSAESSLTSSKYAEKESSPTSTPQRSISPLKSSQLSFRPSILCKKGLSHSPPPGDCPTPSKLRKTRPSPSSVDQEGLKSVCSKHAGWKHCHSSKMRVRACKSKKRGVKLKTVTNINFATSDSAKGACRCSPSYEVGLRSPLPNQGIHRPSKSTETPSEKAPSDQWDTQASNSEHEVGKPSSIPTEECMRTTLSHEDSLRHPTSPHEIPRHATSTRRKQRKASLTQGALQTSPTDQECIESSPDGDSPRRGVKLSSSPQEDISHSVSTKEDSKHIPNVQEGEKPSRSAKREPIAFVPILWGFIPPKASTTFPFGRFPVMRRYYRRTLSQAEDVVPALSCPWRDPSLQYEFGFPLCDHSVLGGHKYTRHMKINLNRIARQKGSCSSFLSPKGGVGPSQSDQCGLRLSSSHQRDTGFVIPVSERLRMLQAERGGLSNAPSKKLGLTDAFYDKRDIVNALGGLRLTPCFRLPPSAQGHIRASQPAKWNL
uniref:Uncharacterized protein n=4 Tax=Mus musculus TaxID=10090 RepID=A0A9L6KDT8_MOUSE